jgi:SAM-dependent methyltransferase
MDVPAHNRAAWNKESSSGTSRWCQPVSSDEIRAARQGNWSVILTPNKSVPPEWFGKIKGKKVLCLASGGGQQAPILAAAGASVTSFDNSEEQLAKDRFVAERDSLALDTVLGDMADLSVFKDRSFDLVFHPVSNVFVEYLKPIWNECFRVLKWNGRLLSGFSIRHISFLIMKRRQRRES